MKVFNYCLFNNSEDFEKLPNSKKLTKICQQSRHLNLSVSSDNSLDDPTYDTDIRIFFKNKNNGNTIFSLNITHLHALVTSSLSTNNDSEIPVNVLEKIFRFYPILISGFAHLILVSKIEALYPLIATHFNNFSANDQKKIAFIVLDQKIKPLYNVLQQSLKYVNYETAKIILKDNEKTFFPLLEKKYKKVRDKKLILFLRLAIQFRADHLFPIIEKRLSSLPQQTAQDLQKILDAQKEYANLVASQKKLKTDARTLLEAPNEETFMPFFNEYELYKKSMAQLLALLPVKNKELSSLNIIIIQKTKKLSQKLFDKLAHKYQETQRAAPRKTETKIKGLTLSQIFSNINGKVKKDALNQINRALESL